MQHRWETPWLNPGWNRIEFRFKIIEVAQVLLGYGRASCIWACAAGDALQLTNSLPVQTGRTGVVILILVALMTVRWRLVGIQSNNRRQRKSSSAADPLPQQHHGCGPRNVWPEFRTSGALGMKPQLFGAVPRGGCGWGGAEEWESVKDSFPSGNDQPMH